MTYRTGKRGGGSGGGGTPAPSMDNGIGFFNYQNAGPVQRVEANTWTTMQNNAAGIFTELRYAPIGVDRMLDPATGRILLDDLMPGDQVYIRQTLNIVPFMNGMSILFRNFVGQAGQQYSAPFGPSISLDAGAGTPTGLFVIDGQFYIRDENTRIGGLLPQIQSDGTCEVEYSGVYISVMRRVR